MIEVEIEAVAWTEAVPDAEAIAVRAAEAALGGRAGDGIAILLTDDDAVRDLNARFRKKDAPTNVLSFPAAANPINHLGDVALAFGVCAAEAQAQGKSLADHLSHLVAHGVLHLLGYDHETDADAEAMEAHERAVLAPLGIPDPYGERLIPRAG
jgi:probable rRNA maturation factor